MLFSRCKCAFILLQIVPFSFNVICRALECIILCRSIIREGATLPTDMMYVSKLHPFRNMLKMFCHGQAALTLLAAVGIWSTLQIVSVAGMINFSAERVIYYVFRLPKALRHFLSLRSGVVHYRVQQAANHEFKHNYLEVANSKKQATHYTVHTT